MRANRPRCAGRAAPIDFTSARHKKEIPSGHKKKQARRGARPQTRRAGPLKAAATRDERKKMTEHSWFGPASQASQQCSQDLHTMFPLLPPSSAFYENSQDEYPADGPHNVSSRTMTARTVTMSQPPPDASENRIAVPSSRRHVEHLYTPRLVPNP